MVRSRRLQRDQPADAFEFVAPGPVRTCVGCRRRGSPDTLVRLVAADGPPGFVIGRSLPGRGAWLCRADATLLPSDACLGEAVRRKAFARAFRVSAASRN